MAFLDFAKNALSKGKELAGIVDEFLTGASKGFEESVIKPTADLLFGAEKEDRSAEFVPSTKAELLGQSLTFPSKYLQPELKRLGVRPSVAFAAGLIADIAVPGPEVGLAGKGEKAAKELEPLLSEARKYKTAEEFVGGATKESIGIEAIKPNRADTEVRKTLVDSIRKDGYAPIIVSRDGVVLDGNNRLRALRSMGEKTIDVVRLNKTDAELSKIPAKEYNEFIRLALERPKSQLTSLWEQAQKGSKTATNLPRSLSQIAESAPEQVSGGAGGSFPPSLPRFKDSVNKIVNALKEAKPVRAAQEKLYSAERGKRLGAVLGVRAQQGGESGFYKELSQLKGELPKAEFESLRGKIQQEDIDNVFNMVTQSARISDFEKISAQQGLVKMFGEAGGSVPTRKELQLLGRVFPPELMKELLAKRPLLTKIGEGVIEALNVPRSIMSSFDLSAPFRQGIALVGKPKQFFPAFAEMFKVFGSERAYAALMESIESRPTYKVMRDAKLALTDIGTDLSAREERFMSNFAERIPGVGRVIRASSRAYTGFLNKLRADVFDDLLAKATSLGYNKTDNPDLARDIARFVNSATGRGELGPLERSAQILNSVFFSPRLMASRVNLLNPAYYVRLDPFVRKEAIKTMLTTGSLALTVLGLSALGGANVGTDPRNADFGKIKIGDTRFDVLGGFQQYIRLAAQLISGKIISSTTGKTITLGEGYKPLTRLDILERFFMGKENPIASFITSALQGQDVIGQPFEARKAIIDRFIPMVAQDAVEAMKEWGVGRGILLSIPSVFGIGTQTYNSKTAPGPTKVNRFNP